METIKGVSFTELPRASKAALISIVAILLFVGAFLCIDAARERDNPAWLDPGKYSPPVDTPILCLYLISGEIVPVRAKMTYIFDAKLNKTEFWHIDSDVAQHDLGRPYRWAYLPAVPDLLLWATKKGN